MKIRYSIILMSRRRLRRAGTGPNLGWTSKRLLIIFSKTFEIREDGTYLLFQLRLSLNLF